jgi:hypothetical protein
MEDTFAKEERKEGTDLQFSWSLWASTLHRKAKQTWQYYRPEQAIGGDDWSEEYATSSFLGKFPARSSHVTDLTWRAEHCDMGPPRNVMLRLTSAQTPETHTASPVNSW